MLKFGLCLSVAMLCSFAVMAKSPMSPGEVSASDQQQAQANAATMQEFCSLGKTPIGMDLVKFTSYCQKNHGITPVVSPKTLGSFDHIMGEGVASSTHELP